jgi:chemotaxis signal transduction protein
MEGGRVVGRSAEIRPEMSEQEITNRENAQELEPVSGEQINPLPEDEAVPERQYCVFRAGRERFCLSVLDVEEVVEWPGLTRMPLAPSFVMGIFNLRGGIVPVIDIAFTEGRRSDLTPRHVVVAAFRTGEEQDEVRVGIAADEVMGTYATAEPLMIDEAPRDVPHCGGMLRHEDKLALAIDLRKLADAFPVPVI